MSMIMMHLREERNYHVSRRGERNHHVYDCDVSKGREKLPCI